MSEYFVEVKKLIEETYLSNDNATVIILTHSMGSPMMLYFLNNQVKAKNEKCFFFIFIRMSVKRGFYYTPPRNKKKKHLFIVCNSRNFDVILIFVFVESLAWKEKYVRSLVTLAAPWGGTVRALKVLYKVINKYFNKFNFKKDTMKFEIILVDLGFTKSKQNFFIW